MNNIDSTKKIQFTTEVVEDVSDFLKLKLTFNKEYKRISVEIFAKATTSFTYVLPSTFFLRTALEMFLKVLHYD